jgi:hypothetical protein
MPHFIARIVTIGGIITVVTGLAPVSCTAARAHEWYPLSCCNTSDCYETGAGKREPDPVYTPQGWRLHDGAVVPFSKARVSPDGKFHVCRWGGKPTASMIQPTNEPACLWAPATSF